MIVDISVHFECMLLGRRYIMAKLQEHQVLANSIINGRISDKHDDCVKNIWR